jgi:hypothetical protein
MLWHDTYARTYSVPVYVTIRHWPILAIYMMLRTISKYPVTRLDDVFRHIWQRWWWCITCNLSTIYSTNWCSNCKSTLCTIHLNVWTLGRGEVECKQMTSFSVKNILHEDKVDDLPSYKAPNATDAKIFFDSSLPRRIKDANQPTGHRQTHPVSFKQKYQCS